MPTIAKASLNSAERSTGTLMKMLQSKAGIPKEEAMVASENGRLDEVVGRMVIRKEKKNEL